MYASFHDELEKISKSGNVLRRLRELGEFAGEAGDYARGKLRAHHLGRQAAIAQRTMLPTLRRISIRGGKEAKKELQEAFPRLYQWGK